MIPIAFKDSKYTPLSVGGFSSNTFDFLLPEGESSLIVEISDLYGGSTEVPFLVDAPLSDTLSRLSSDEIVNELFGRGSILTYTLSSTKKSKNFQLQILYYIAGLLSNPRNATSSKSKIYLDLYSLSTDSRRDQSSSSQIALTKQILSFPIESSCI